MNKTILVVLFFMCQIFYGQNDAEKLLRGSIRVDSVYTSGINVLNLVNKKSAITNSNGEFFILAKANDILVFTAVNLISHRKLIKEEDLMLDILNIKMASKATELKEVIVNKNPINAVSQGILAKNPISYSPAERRLRTAGDFKPIMLLNLLGGTMPLDPLINKINGRTKRLKKLVVLEQKEHNIKLISKIYNQEYFTVKLGIPIDYVNGFKYFVVENENFLKVLESKNEERTSFFMVALAQEYKDKIKQ
ncbi:peptidase associated/transthyretin-like domain-containing protein [Flavobacterium glaciei]|uniref:Carboxypeptidase-like protein n=1 Tax=Flavobacterium glaciei TaxID=386300 RepID=A0A562PS52_9FLAO|nr:hypothetical protein [Flavobacterium glaciei]RDI54739.1 hypothetical protein DFR66_10763 [Flavobacterium glaciei]TWI47193.1 hypothetical protein IQ02_01647 [Flavobacterium glaciei]